MTMKHFYGILALAFVLALQACSSAPYNILQEDLVLSKGDQKIFGVLYRPEGVKKAPVVIVSHGFGGNHQIGKAYADALVPMGYALYCYDFCGGSVHSRSDGKTTEMSIFTEEEDLKAVMDGLLDLDGIDRDGVILLGESQGGMVSALVAADRKDLVDRLILIFPALCIKDDWVSRYPSLEDMPEEVDMWGTPLSHTYLEGLHDLDVYADICRYEGPVHIYHGDKDAIVPLSYSEKAQESYKDAVLTVMPGEGHGFRPEAQKSVIESIAEELF